MRKIILALAVLVILFSLFILSCSNTQSSDGATGGATFGEEITIGAILPLSGPAAVWGESIMNGMEIAREELEREGTKVKFIYEDSKVDPATGVSAYHNLINNRDVDVIFSAFSRVSIPLVPLAEENKVPLVMTMVAAKDVTKESDQSFRFYLNVNQYALPHIENMDVDKYREIAVLSINDEYGKDVSSVLINRAMERGINVVSHEEFSPGSTDFRTQLTKIKSKSPKVILVISAVPPELINAVKQIKELNINTEIMEASLNLCVEGVRKSLGELAEGVKTLCIPFDLKKTGNDFRNDYVKAYNKNPDFASSFVHDMVELVGKAGKLDGIGGESLSDEIRAVRFIDSTNGLVEIQNNGEINPDIYPVTIRNGELVR